MKTAGIIVLVALIIFIISIHVGIILIIKKHNRKRRNKTNKTP